MGYAENVLHYFVESFILPVYDIKLPSAIVEILSFVSKTVKILHVLIGL